MTSVAAVLMVLGAFPEYLFEPGLLAGNHLALEGSPASVFHTPALIPDGTKVAFSCSRPYSIPGLRYGSVALSEKGFGFGATYFGNETYSEVVLVFGRRHNITPDFRFGVAFKGMALSLKEFPTELRFSLDSSIRYAPVSYTILGLSVRNVASFFVPDDEVLPSFEVSMKVVESAALSGMVDCVVEQGEQSVRVSGCIHLTPVMELSLGISSEPDMVHFGVALGSSPEVRYSLREHPYLGETHSVALTFGR